jgi:hypothetical protein
MCINTRFSEVVDDFESIKGTLPNLAAAELHKTAHKYNATIGDLIHDIEETMSATAMSVEERKFHLCRIETLDEIILHLAMEIDQRIQMVA